MIIGADKACTGAPEKKMTLTELAGRIAENAIRIDNMADQIESRLFGGCNSATLGGVEPQEPTLECLLERIVRRQNETIATLENVADHV